MANTMAISKSKARRWRRSDVESAIVRVVHRGRGYQSSVYVAELDGCCVAIKDFAKTSRAFRRWVAPFLVRRECAALRRLQGVPGVPQFYGRIDRLSLAMEYIEGRPLDTFAQGELPTEAFARAQEVIDAMHARGVSHGDLKRRSNLLLTPGGEIYLIDFATAIIDSRGKRWLQRELARVDDKSVPRLKKFVAPELLTADDKHKLENPTKLERGARRWLNRSPIKGKAP